MKTMKLMLCMAALFCATTLMAQNPPQGTPPQGGKDGGRVMINGTPAEKAAKMADMLKKRLTLSDDQTKQATAVYLDYFTKEEALQTARESAIDKLLTPEQLKKMQENRTQAKMRMEERKGDGGARSQR